MPQNREVRMMLRAAHLTFVAIFVLALALVGLCIESFAQTVGDVRAGPVKAGLLVSGGAGSSGLTYRGKTYPFRSP